MTSEPPLHKATTTCTAFAGSERAASGALPDVVRACKPLVDAGQSILIFDDATADPIEVDFRGSVDDVLHRLVAPGPPVRSAGRPRLGVVGREVTLLPRHWDWLNAQPGGASVALRRLVEQARRTNADADRARRAQDVAFRFMSAVTGDQPGFEEACRALFSGSRAAFEQHTQAWPPDVRVYAMALGRDAFLHG